MARRWPAPTTAHGSPRRSHPARPRRPTESKSASPKRRARRQSRGLWATPYLSGSLRPRRLNRKGSCETRRRSTGRLAIGLLSMHRAPRAAWNWRPAGPSSNARSISPGDWRPGHLRARYAALVVPIHGDALLAFDQITVTASAPRPTRVSAQIRIPQGAGLRWRRSIYLDETPRTLTVRLSDMRPIEAPPGTALDLSKADTLLFVVDTVNAYQARWVRSLSPTSAG